MSSPWTWGLVAIALVTMGCSYRLPRAWWWLGIGGLDFFVTTLFKDYGPVDLHPWFTVFCDVIVCGLTLKYGNEDWEYGVSLAFLVSVFTSCLVLGLIIKQAWVYASLLELCNLAAMICISTTGIIEMIGRDDSSPLHSIRDRLRHARHMV